MELFKALSAGVLVVLIAGRAFADGPDRPGEDEIRDADAAIAAEFADAVDPFAMKGFAFDRAAEKYAHLDPKGEVPDDLLAAAVAYFDANRSKFPNDRFIAIVDFRPRSDRSRFFLIDVNSGAVEKYHTTHGEGSDANRDGTADSFGNVENSFKSSLGFARTAEVYDGAYRRSLRLDGLSSTNSNLRRRAIVVHGWDGAYEADRLQGLTQGCLAFDWKIKDSIIDKLKNGALIYSGVSRL